MSDIATLKAPILNIIGQFAPSERDMANLYWDDVVTQQLPSNRTGSAPLGFGIPIDVGMLLSQVIVQVAVYIAKESVKFTIQQLAELLRQQITRAKLQLAESELRKLAAAIFDTLK